ncbi:hypothetical protein Tco_1165839 [Tanacetum coccineum]
MLLDEATKEALKDICRVIKTTVVFKSELKSLKKTIEDIYGKLPELDVTDVDNSAFFKELGLELLRDQVANKKCSQQEII